MSNYPEGVTGMEFEIAGPDGVRDETHEVYCSNENCRTFESDKEVTGESTFYDYTVSFSWICSTCKTDYIEEWVYNYD